MLSAISLSLVLASGVSAPAPQRILQTIRTTNDGKTTVERRTVDAAATTLRSVGPNGRVVEATLGPERRVLIEIRERPKLHRTLPGSAAVALLQRQQLERDLTSLDGRLHTRTPSRITRQYDTLFGGVAATVDSAAIAEIRRLPNVVAVHNDAEVRASLTESVPLIGATAVAGTYGVTGAGVRVAVLDTGIDYTHADLGGCLGAACKVIDGYDFVNDDEDPRDDHGHGTHVAGIIAANGTLKGVAPGATLLAYKVLDSNGFGSFSDIIAGLEQAVLDGAKVANLSLGGSGNPDDPVSQAIDNATAAGMLSVVAAGNFGPGYQTVDSPGVARTALTVGATDKSWQMAWFSARGYVEHGEQLVMKPEVVAPGMAIRSTVPTTGILGDPSGYRALDGTSMATPHVAGSAALLLQWKPAQTPAEVKNRLASTARPIDGDLFTRGVGGIDLVAAFGVNSFPTTTHVPFGVIDQSSGIIVREQTLTLRNAGTIAETLTLAVDAALPTGATLQIIPSSSTLAPGASQVFTLRLEADAAVVPEAPDPLVWSTNIAVTGGAQTVRVPAYFFKGSLINLSFDVPPYSVYLNSETGNVRSFYGLGTSLSVLVKSGLWDVITTYIQSPSPVIVVVHEQQNVQQTLSLSIHRAQATRNVTIRAIDDAEQPLSAGMFSKEIQLRISGFVMSIGGPDDFRLSDLSSRFAVGIGGSGPDPSGQRFFATNWAGEGLASDINLPAAGVPYRRLTQAVAPPSEPPATMVFMTGFAMQTTWGGLGLVGGSIWPGVLGRTWYIQSNASPGLPILPVHKTSLLNASNFDRLIEGPYLRQKNMDLEVSPNPFFDLFDPLLEPDAVLDPAVERWDLEMAPNALPLQFVNTASFLQAYGFGAPSWMTHTVSTLERVAGAQPVFELYRNGALQGTYPFTSLNAGISSLPGLHEIRATSGYTINGVSGSSRAVFSFNTTSTDRDPPFVTRFRIEQNGLRTPTPAYPAVVATPRVKFRVTDHFSVGNVTLEWRTNGTTTWTPLALSQAGSDYDASLNAEGAIDLRLTAVDGAGNSFQEEWTPAVITTPAVPPSPPASLAATRAGTSTISVSWTPASSQVGIAGYHIERFPDNVTALTDGPDTTFSDSNGLVPGNAYFYRVAAIDTNNAVSTPSGYDVATLIELHDDPIVPGLTAIRGIHIADLRRAIDAIRNAAGLASAWTNYDSPAGLVNAWHFVDLRDRLNEARGNRQLPDVQFTGNVATGAPILADDVQKLRDGVK